MQLMGISAPLRHYVLGSWAAVAGRAWTFLMAHLERCCDECLEVCTQPTLLLVASLKDIAGVTTC